jgi:hypothetical protein
MRVDQEGIDDHIPSGLDSGQDNHQDCHQTMLGFSEIENERAGRYLDE